MAQISIVATVNGKPITNYDVEQRLLFLQYATNIAITDANRERLTNDALQLLIDDMLKTNAAEDAIPDLGALLLPEVEESRGRESDVALTLKVSLRSRLDSMVEQLEQAVSEARGQL